MKLSMPRGSAPHRMISLFLRILEGKDHPSSIFFSRAPLLQLNPIQFGGVFVEGSAEKWDPRHCFCRRKHRGFLFIQKNLLQYEVRSYLIESFSGNFFILKSKLSADRPLLCFIYKKRGAVTGESVGINTEDFFFSQVFYYSELQMIKFGKISYLWLQSKIYRVVFMHWMIIVLLQILKFNLLNFPYILKLPCKTIIMFYYLKFCCI